MLVGKTLRYRYSIIKQLGSGGFGDTYLAEDKDLPGNPSCVVKHLKSKYFEPAVLTVAKSLFNREAEVLYRLGNEHDQIPRLFAHFEENGEFYLVQEFVEGHDLSKELTPGKQLSEAEVVKLLQDILEVLAFVHEQNIIHRDIKPQNLMRRKDGKIVLIDFGAVKEINALTVDAQGQTSWTVPIGTPGYMPSEQTNGHPKLCSDIYAVGMIGIQALTGLLPQQLQKYYDSLEIIWRDRVQVNSRLADVISTMLRSHFSQRYQSALEALQFIKTSLTSSVKFQIEPQFDEALSFSEGLAAIRLDNKWGYIDKSGKVIIKPQFDCADSFSDGLAAVRRGDEYCCGWGYINKIGEYIIKPRFDQAFPFFEGMAKVDGYRFINKRGRLIGSSNKVLFFNEALSFSEGLAAVKVYDKWGYINSRGNFVIEPQFDKALSFSKGLAAVSTRRPDYKWGFIDKRGNFVIEPQFDGAFSFSEGLAAVRLDYYWGFIDKTGNFVIQPEIEEYSFDSSTDLLHFTDYSFLKFSEGRAIIKIKTWRYGYIDRNGNNVIKLWGSKLSGVALPEHFSEELAGVLSDNGYWGFIDRFGNIVIPFQYDNCWTGNNCMDRQTVSFSEGLAAVKVGEKWGYIRNPLL